MHVRIEIESFRRMVSGDDVIRILQLKPYGMRSAWQSLVFKQNNNRFMGNKKIKSIS